MPETDVAILAALELAKGKTLDEICETVKAASENPSGPLLDEDEEKHSYYVHRHNLAFLRLVTGKIDNLTREETEDVVCCVVHIPGASFDLWMQRKGLR